MITISSPKRLLIVASLGLALAASAQPVFQLVQLNTAQTWQRLEFRILGLPTVTNPFDPDTIRVDGVFTSPSGQTATVPAYWHQTYQRTLSGGNESLSKLGSPEWRLRYAPSATGSYLLTVTVRTNGQPCGLPATTNFTVSGSPPASGAGYVRVDASRQHFVTGDGQPLRLIGENVCWPGSRGTFDYDDWFAAMQAAGENYARLWMWPSSFGIETATGSLNKYQLDHAWQLDYVFHLAEQRGIYLELCLDYHGMFAVDPDYWGGNNYWPANPYCVTNGGPCGNQNAFFTNVTAQTIYQKRLRYLVARYGYSPNLLGWQFFNEIDNVYSYLRPTDVAAWHGLMGSWLGTNDPFGHLRTTSFAGADPRPEMWSLPQMDYVCHHSYGQPAPAMALSVAAQSLLHSYGKPVLIDEYGTSWQGWNRAADPHLRGFRQGLWGGALGGSAGNAMSWYWESVHSENAYPDYTAMGTILRRTGWGCGAWTNIAFLGSLVPPTTVSNALPGGQAFTITLPLDSGWANRLPGQLAVPSAAAAEYSPSTLNSFVHGTSHADLRIPFRLSAWFTNNARLVMHLNSVSSGAILVVRADGTQLYRTNLPNLDGTYNVNNEYNLDIPVNLPAGKRLIEISNAGADWFYVDWVRLEQVLPATYPNNWQPPSQPIGLRGPHESLLYVVAPGTAFPAGATNSALPLQHGQSVTFTNWPPGCHYAEWYDPATAKLLGYSLASTTNQSLTLALPDYSEDLAAVVYPPPILTPLALSPTGAFQFRFDSETGGRYVIQESSDLAHWTTFLTLTNLGGSSLLSDPTASTNSPTFFRAAQIRAPGPSW